MHIVGILNQYYTKIIWSFDPRALRSKNKISELRDKYRGETCYILCSGPSLKKVNKEIKY